MRSNWTPGPSAYTYREYGMDILLPNRGMLRGWQSVSLLADDELGDLTAVIMGACAVVPLRNCFL